MSSGSNTQTSTTTSEPADWQKGLYNTLSNDTLTAYQSGALAPVNTMSTVVPYADQSTTAFNAMESNATANMNGSGLSGPAQSILNNGGYNAAQQSSMDYLNGIGTNPYDLSNNEAYQAYRSNTLDDVQNRVNAGASAAGRLGSGDNTGRLVSELTNAGNTLDMNQFSRMDALNSERASLGQQGISNLSTAYDLQNLPIQDLQTVGSAYEDLYGRQLNDELRIAQEQQNAPLTSLQNLAALASGSGQFGTTTSTAQVPGQNPLLTGLGYGLTGLGLLGGF